MVGEADLPREEGHDDLYRKAAPIDEVSVEQVWVALGWSSVYLEDIQQVIVLPVDVATNCDFFLVLSMDVYKRFVLLENFFGLFNDHTGIFFVEDFSIFLVLHQLLYPF